MPPRSPSPTPCIFPLMPLLFFPVLSEVAGRGGAQPWPAHSSPAPTHKHDFMRCSCGRLTKYCPSLCQGIVGTRVRTLPSASGKFKGGRTHTTTQVQLEQTSNVGRIKALNRIKCSRTSEINRADKGVSVKHKSAFNSGSTSTTSPVSHTFLGVVARQSVTNTSTVKELTGNSLRKYVGISQFSLANSLFTCSDKSVECTSASVSFHPACLRLDTACGFFPSLAGTSGNVCRFRGAESRLRPLSYAQNREQTITDDCPFTKAIITTSISFYQTPKCRFVSPGLIFLTCTKSFLHPPKNLMEL